MGNPGLDPEAALQLFHTLLYCMAYIFGGAAIIGLSIYIVLLGSEIFFSEPRSKTQRARVPQPARCAPMAEETLVPSPAETPILATPEALEEEAVRVTACPRGAQTLMAVPATLESEPTWT